MGETLNENPSGNVAIRKVIKFADTIALIGGYVAVVCLGLMTLLMLCQVGVAALSRVFTDLRGDIPVAWEYGSYLMGATFMLGSGVTLRAGRHIRLGLIVDSAPGWLRNTLEIVSSTLAIAFSVFLTYSLGSAALVALRVGTTSISSSTPIWIPMAAFTVGAAILSLQFAVRLLAVLSGFPLERIELRETMAVSE
mgnify:FL=1